MCEVSIVSIVLGVITCDNIMRDIVSDKMLTGSYDHDAAGFITLS